MGYARFFMLSKCLKWTSKNNITCSAFLCWCGHHSSSLALNLGSAQPSASEVHIHLYVVSLSFGGTSLATDNGLCKMQYRFSVLTKLLDTFLVYISVISSLCPSKWCRFSVCFVGPKHSHQACKKTIQHHNVALQHINTTSFRWLPYFLKEYEHWEAQIN